MTALLFLAVLGQAPVDTPPDPAALLTKTAERYFTLNAYSLEVKQQRFNPGVSMGTTMIRIDRAENDRWRVETGNVMVATGTGDGWWFYNRARRTYFPLEAGPSVRANKQLVYQLVGRFERLGLITKGARFVRWETLKRDLKTSRCAVIELQSVQGENAKWVEQLWIDPEENLILRSNFEIFGLSVMPQTPASGFDYIPLMPPTVGTVIADYRWLRLDAPLDEEAFRFTPPKGARQVKPPSP